MIKYIRKIKVVNVGFAGLIAGLALFGVDLRTSGLITMTLGLVFVAWSCDVEERASFKMNNEEKEH